MSLVSLFRAWNYVTRNPFFNDYYFPPVPLPVPVPPPISFEDQLADEPHSKSLKNQTMKLLNDKIAIQPITEAKVQNGLHIPEKYNLQTRGKVVAVGDGILSSTGVRTPLGVSVGDMVLFDKGRTLEIEVDGQKFLLTDENSILCIMA